MPKGILSLSNNSIPAYSPPYSSGANEFEDITTVMVQYRVAASDIRHLVPNVLEIEEEPLMTCFFITYGTTSVGTYNEYALAAEVLFNGKKYDYSLVLILDNESAIFAGREIFGYPKVFGKVDIQRSNGTRLIQGAAERPVGKPIVQFEFIPEQRMESLPESDKWVLNLRSIPSLAPGQSASIREFVPAFMEMHLKSAWLGKGSVHFTPGTSLHPWSDMKVLRYEGAFLLQHNYAKLHPGQVIPL